MLIQCTFCNLINLVDPAVADPLCVHCKITLPRDTAETSTPPDQAPPEAAPGDIEQVAGEPTGFEELFGAAQNGQAGTGNTDTTPHPSKRAPRRLPAWAWIVMGAVWVVILGVAAASWWFVQGASSSQVSAPVEEPAATADVSVTLDGWESTPAWSIDMSPTQGVVTADGAYLAVIDGDSASVLDTATGDTVATRHLDDASTARLYRSGDMLLVSTDDLLLAWSRTVSDTTSWATIARPSDATTVSLRGDATFLVTEVGATYDIINLDATVSPVPVPTPGAVPVAATGDQLVWGTNKGVAYVTGRDGTPRSDVSLLRGDTGATISRWLGGDARHVYVVWQLGDQAELRVHALDTGDIVSTSPLPAADPHPATWATRSGDTVAVGKLLIDTTTGAITPTEELIVGVVGDRFLVKHPTGRSLLDTQGVSISLDSDLDVFDVGADTLLAAAEGRLVALSHAAPAARGSAAREHRSMQ